MPQVKQMLTEEDIQAKPPRTIMDLSEYIQIIESIQQEGAKGSIVTLGEGETQRTEKRRLSLAAKEKGLELTWRKAADGELKFVVAPIGETAPGSRKRTPKATAEPKATDAPSEQSSEQPRRGRRNKAA